MIIHWHFPWITDFDPNS